MALCNYFQPGKLNNTSSTAVTLNLDPRTHRDLIFVRGNSVIYDTLSEGQEGNAFSKNSASSTYMILCLLNGKGHCHKGCV